ncbi:unnamed protein product [Hermetia illucens]|uniref:Uncharacterized protein n=1 Tax=Hermetia illucens TaxID=343691 RepID=A0A7R8V828_HERIL|nr:unnamed protein product [Hermetia illucens]
MVRSCLLYAPKFELCLKLSFWNYSLKIREFRMSRIIFFTIALLVVAASLGKAQRPPYAGSRPVGYKDRFRPRPTGAAASATSLNDIDNRFGEIANNLDNSTNVTQRPPVGVEVVYGEPSDPSNTNAQDQSNAASGNGQQPQQQEQGVNVVNRLGGSRKSSIVPTATTISATPTIAPFRQTTLNHVPYDAHGDVFLVNLLNQRPVDQQPFWFVNYQAIEAHRNG